MPDYAARTGGFYAALSICQGDWYLASTRRGIVAVAPAIRGVSSIAPKAGRVRRRKTAFESLK